MLPGLAVARYERTTSHALALGGVVAAEIHVLNRATCALELVARSVAPLDLAAPSDSQASVGAGPPTSFHDTTGLNPLFEKALRLPGPHQAPVAQVPKGDSSESQGWAWKRLGVRYLLAERIQVGDEVRGLMLFRLDRPAERVGHEALHNFVADAAAVTDFAGQGQLTQAALASHRLDAVVQVGQASLVGGDLHSTLQAAVDRLRGSFEADVAELVLLDEAGEGMNLMASSASEAGRVIKGRVGPFSLQEGGFTAWIARNRRCALVADTRLDPRIRRREPTASVVAAPLMVDQKVVGVLRVGALGANHFAVSDLRLVEALARQTAVVVEDARLRAKMREQNERLAALARSMEASRDAIFLVDPERRIAHYNPATAALFGYSTEELIGQHVVTLTAQHDAAQLVETIHQALTDSGEWVGEVLERRKDGSEFPGEVRVSAVLDDEGQRTGSVAIVRDLTRRKLQELQEIQSEKLRSLGVMAGGVAHQVNNTLASVLGHADLLLQTVQDVEVRQHLQTIIQAAEDGAAAVRRITEFARARPSTDFQQLDIVALANDVLDATAPQWRDRAGRAGRLITARVVAARPAWVMGSAPELREALTNLVLNAIDALPSGGAITIEIEEARGRVRVNVSDTGTGMAEDVAQRIFDPFFTTKPFGTGTGLGLALAQGAIQRHQGTVRVRTHLGEGTTFEIELPAGKTDLAAASPSPKVDALPLHVLVVEDEPTLAEQLRAMLAIDGHAVQVCRGGAEAVTVLDNVEFDAVLTDLLMPDVSGWDVVRRARERQPGACIGVITGWSGDVDDAELCERGVDFVITKPYSMQTLRAALAQVRQTDSSPLPKGEA